MILSNAVRSTIKSLMTETAERQGSTVNGIAIIETAHVDLAGSSSCCRTVRMSVDIKRAHSADSFAAVVVEYNRLFPFADQLFVEDIQSIRGMGSIAEISFIW